ncbi:Predicted ATPase [Pseudomonas asturiensis]|uniref:Predicted ATPase n=1 Tax=Pseudomonas asturiensis TaxID=1190415 RepID=A0A1M7N520_9PSED|nr:winged helix-turn-helix domain-containing protein [Pseudomonas asturiensis]SHM98132.1 Predicted ATPase [Pseudomonas asturiensis]
MDCQTVCLGQPAPLNRFDTTHSEAVLSFGAYTFNVRQRLVTRGGTAVRLGSRALDILQILIESAGEVVSKQALLDQVWPRSCVEEINLRVHVAALRRALNDGQRYIETIPQHGYRFIARVDRTQAGPAAPPARATHNLPVPLNPVIGRDEVIGRLMRQLPAKRFMSLVGAGGVGKSSVACRVADALSGRYADGVWLIDFSVVNDEQSLADCLSGLLDSKAASSLHNLFIETAKGRRLLIFDNCEALHERCARWAGALLALGGDLVVLATSRRPLGIPSETVYRLEPLAFPSAGTPCSVGQGLAYSAVQLFVNRAQARQQGWVVRERDMAVIGDICRKLDGLPLAMELAAAQIEVFALMGLQAQLAHCVHWLTQGRRSAVARHQSLRASLDWSCLNLDEQAQRVLRRLAVFEAAFTRESAVDVIGCDGLGAQSVREGIMQLERHSLLSSMRGAGDEGMRYRLLHTTRLYALEKLEHSGELQTFATRHARHLSLQRWLAAKAQSVQLVE